MRGANPWFTTQTADSGADLRLYCLPYAGGSASTYLGWSDLLGGNTDVCAVQLPGRGSRLREPPRSDAQQVAMEVADEISDHADGPFALLGHSMGGLLAYEVAQQLRRVHGPQPIALIVSGRRAPEYPEPYPDIRSLSDAELVAELDRRYGRLASVLSNVELRGAFLPSIRADFTICERYRRSTCEPIPYPIFAYGGTADKDVSPTELAAWRAYTSDQFTMTMVPGGHFFIEQRFETFIGYLRRDLHCMRRHR